MKSDEAGLILRGVLALGRRLRAERPAGGVGLTGLGILGALQRAGPLPAARLAEGERLQPQSLTRIIRGLEGDGLIARVRSRSDRRQILIALTPAGRRLLAGEVRSRHRWLERAVSRELTAREREALVAAAGLMLKLAEQAQPPAAVSSRQGARRRASAATRERRAK